MPTVPESSFKMPSDDATTSPSELEAAYTALVEIVTRFWKSGRSTRSAAIKQALQLTLDPPFEERRLGFDNFRDFLKAAEHKGLVALARADRGPDVDVLPPHARRNSCESLGLDGRKLVRLRSDLWTAFTRWDKGYVRFWDPRSKRAFMLLATPASNESTQNAAVRAAWLANPEHFIPIDCVPVETVLAWMHDFVARQPSGPERMALDNALKDDLPVREFIRLVRRLDLGNEWHREHLKRVLSVVREWMTRYGLEIDLSPNVEPPAEASPALQRDEPRREIVANLPAEDEVALRVHVHKLINQMTMPELLQLAVPLRLLTRR